MYIFLWRQAACLFKGSATAVKAPDKEDTCRYTSCWRVTRIICTLQAAFTYEDYERYIQYCMLCIVHTYEVLSGITELPDVTIIDRRNGRA